VAPVRFLLFLLVFLTVAAVLTPVATPTPALLIGFDAGALLFLILVIPLLRHHQADDLRRHAAENDANRPMLLAITSATMLVILTTVAVALTGAVGAS